MDIRENLKAFLDGELSPTDAALVAEAIRTDPMLAEEVEVLRSIGNLLLAARSEFEPVGKEELLARFAAKPRRTRMRWLIPCLTAGAVALVFVAAVSRFSQPYSDASTFAVAAMDKSSSATFGSSASAEAKAMPLFQNDGLVANLRENKKVALAKPLVAVPDAQRQPKRTFHESPTTPAGKKTPHVVERGPIMEPGPVDAEYVIDVTELDYVKEMATKDSAHFERTGPSSAEIIVDDASFAKLKGQLEELSKQRDEETNRYASANNIGPTNTAGAVRLGGQSSNQTHELSVQLRADDTKFDAKIKASKGPNSYRRDSAALAAKKDLHAIDPAARAPGGTPRGTTSPNSQRPGGGGPSQGLQGGGAGGGRVGGFGGAGSPPAGRSADSPGFAASKSVSTKARQESATQAKKLKSGGSLLAAAVKPELETKPLADQHGIPLPATDITTSPTGTLASRKRIRILIRPQNVPNRAASKRGPG